MLSLFVIPWVIKISYVYDECSYIWNNKFYIEMDVDVITGTRRDANAGIGE